MVRRLPWFLLVALFSAWGCDAALSGSRHVPSELQERISRKEAHVLTNRGDQAALVELGLLYVEAGRMFKAAETLIEAEARGAKDVRIDGGLAIAYLDLEYYEQAYRRTESCLSKNREHPDCLYPAARLFEAQGTVQTLQQAEVAWSRLLEVAPNHPKAPYAMSSLEQIRAQLRQAQKPASQPAEGTESPSPPASNQDAAEQAHRSAGVIPGHPGVSEGESVGGLTPFGQAIQRAFAGLRNNDPAEAEAGYRDALKIKPEDPTALAGLAEVLYEQRKLAEATPVIARAFETSPDDAQVRYVFGLVMLTGGQRINEAVAAWESLIKENPEFAKRKQIQEKLDSIRKVSSGPKDQVQAP